ncbi:MAG: CD1247 N-terminal domain-containing protein [Dysosmobacter sp.]
MEISEKVAYLKGLAEGLALDTDTKEGKLIAAIIDVLDDMSGKFEDLEDELCDVEDGLTPSATTCARWRRPSTSWRTMTTSMTRTRMTTGVLRDHLPRLRGGDRVR